jgi:hypothetical protein
LLAIRKLEKIPFSPFWEKKEKKKIGLEATFRFSSSSRLVLGLDLVLVLLLFFHF